MLVSETRPPAEDTDTDSVHLAAREINLLIEEAKRLRRRRWYSIGLVSAVVVGVVVLTIDNNGARVKPVANETAPSTEVGLAVAPCSNAQLQIQNTYQPLAGLGSVNELFWVKNVSGRSCSIKGYPALTFISPTGADLHVKVTDSYGRSGNEFGGLRQGLAVPTSALSALGGVASFWVYGTDESHFYLDGKQSTCIQSNTMLVTLPGAKHALTLKRPRHSGSFYWCGGVWVHPVVPGRSGSDPAVPLTHYFGTPLPARQ
jgi:hypothetical protein